MRQANLPGSIPLMGSSGGIGTLGTFDLVLICLPYGGLRSVIAIQPLVNASLGFS
jgi:hypothetical protein